MTRHGWIQSLASLPRHVDAEARRSPLVRRRRPERRLHASAGAPVTSAFRDAAEGGVPMKHRSKHRHRHHHRHNHRHRQARRQAPASFAATGAPADRRRHRRRCSPRRWSTACSGAPASGRPPQDRAHVDRPAAVRRRQLAALDAGGAVAAARDQRRQPARPDRQRHRPRAQLDRPDGPRRRTRSSSGSTFFWHRHWANSRESGLPAAAADDPERPVPQLRRLRRQPERELPQMAYDVTIDPSMLRYLTGEYNVKGAPNENYARELMELFTLGVHDANGNAELQPGRRRAARQGAVRLADQRLTTPTRSTATSRQSRWYNGPKIVFGQFGNFNSTDAVNLVLAPPGPPGVPRHRAVERVHRRAAGCRRR